MKPELTLGQALRQGASFLARAGVEAPQLTAEVLLAHALGRPRVYLHAHREEPLTELAWIHYGRWLAERAGGKPTQYITRKQEFWGREFYVAPGALIPRPETEHVIERALAIGPPAIGAIVDVGTGSGCIAVILSTIWRRPVIAIDRSAAALEVARRNTAGTLVELVQGDLLTAIRNAGLIVTNPPYLPSAEALPPEVAQWEPPEALYGGPDGLDVWRAIIATTPPGAWLVGEIDSRAEIGPLFATGWEHYTVTPDLAGRPRVVSACRAV